MKLHDLFLALFMCCIFTGCKEKSLTITITGELEGVEDSTIIYLNETKERMFVNLAKDTVIDGKFKFSLTDSLGEAKQLAITVRGKGFPPTWLSLWAAPGKEIKVIGKDKQIRSWDVVGNVPQQKELNTYKKRIKDFEYQTQLIMTEAYACFDSMRAHPSRGKEFRSQVDSLYAINDSLNDLILKAEVDLLEEKKTYSEVWIDKLNFYTMQIRYQSILEKYVEKMRSLYNGMPEELKKSELGESIYLSLNQPKVVKNGDDIADSDMWDVDGNLHHLTNYKGKYILIDFWSSGCGPCIMSMPEMKEISETYSDKLVVVSISSDAKEIWTKVSKEKEITWMNLNDFKGENGIKLQYGVKGIPHYVMASPEGKVITSWTGYGKGLLKAKVKEWVK